MADDTYTQGSGMTLDFSLASEETYTQASGTTLDFSLTSKPTNTIHVEKATGELTLNTAYTPLRHDPANGEIGTSSDLPNYLILDPSTGEINSQLA